MISDPTRRIVIRFGVMRVGHWCCLGVVATGCAFDVADPDPPAGTPGGSGSSQTGDPEDPSATTATSSGMPDPDPSGATSAGTPTSGTSGDDPTTGSSSDDTGEVEVGCPNPLPPGWILCEDFEGIDDPAAHFATWQGPESPPGMDLQGPGHDSPTALQITHQLDVTWSGVVQLRFGDGPPATNVAQPEGSFDEVWVRFHTRVAEGWPIMGPGDLLSVGGVSESPPGAITFVARVTADQDDPELFSSVRSCIFGSVHNCNGTQDWEFLTDRGSERGSEPVFGDLAESWTCVVLHARLNTAGQANGVLEVLVEDTLDSQIQNIDYRGTRADFGFNEVRIPTYIEQPMSEPHTRYIDDVVVSATSLDCD